MGRRKLSMELIANRKKRMRSFANRKQGLIKKASELSKLCDVETAVIIYGPDNVDDQPAHVWPNEPNKLNHILERYCNTCVDERRKKAQDMSSMLMVDKGKTTLLAAQVKNGHVECGGDMRVKGAGLDDDGFINGLSVEQLMGLCSYLDSKIGLVDSRIEMKKKSNVDQQWSMNMMMQPSLGYGYDQMMNADQLMMMNANADQLMRGPMMNDSGGGGGGGSTGSNSNTSNVDNHMGGNYGTGFIGVDSVQDQIGCYRDPLELLNSNMPVF